MSIIQRLSSISALPTLPEVALKVQQLMFSEDASAAQLSKIIEQDPSITTTVLRVANSSFYGATGRVSSVATAITRLGFNEIGHIVTATSVIKKLSQKSGVLNYKQFWKHALTAAHMAAITVKMSEAKFTLEECQSLYLTGLLHDIGILIYDQFFHEEFKEILEHAAQNEISYLEAERAVAPKETHAAVGAALFEMWKISPSVTNGVRFHHAPEKAPDNQKLIPYAIYLSEYILCNSGIGSFEGLITREAGSLLGELKINPENLPKYLLEAQNEVEKSDLILALDGADSGSGQNPDKLLRTI
jgi:HD-like signal output (HDOD) protein